MEIIVCSTDSQPIHLLKRGILKVQEMYILWTTLG